MDGSRHVEEVSQIGKFRIDKRRPLRVRVKNMNSKKEILKRAKELHDTVEYKSDCISPDLMRQQQDVVRDLRERVSNLRDKGEKDANIRSGKIV